MVPSCGKTREVRMRPLIAGNWKMHGTGTALGEILAVANSLAEQPPGCDVLICPPFTMIARAAVAAGGNLDIGGQNCHAQPCGAFTGDVSAEMVVDAGASAVILGHSERRRLHGETDIEVASKTGAAWRAGLLAIVCVGETEEQHDAGMAPDVVARQLDASLPLGARGATTAIAYEPVWAIGSGRTPAPQEIAAMHGLIRDRLLERLGMDGGQLRVLYGGSVKPDNARSILALPNVNGALVGGASLKAEEFLAIIRAVKHLG
jgi:triosephosphate isomerase